MDRPSRRRDDNAPPKRHKAKRHRRSSLGDADFSNMLAAAALKKGKVAPLFAKNGNNKTIRLRALQHMVVCYLRRNLAGEVKQICDTNSAPPDQMDRVQKMMKHYGPQANPKFPVSLYYHATKSLEQSLRCATCGTC